MDSQDNSASGCEVDINQDAIIPTTDNTLSRREAIFDVAATGVGVAVAGAASIGGFPSESQAIDEYQPSKRPFSYLVDSTIPPTLIGLKAQKEVTILKNLGRGSGTSKVSATDTQVNLNNIMNLAIFGTIRTVKTQLGLDPDEQRRSGPGYATFTCLGLPTETSPEDIELAKTLLTFILEPRKGGRRATAIGVWFAPYSAQPVLDSYAKSGDENALQDGLKDAGVDEGTIGLYLPVLRFAKTFGVDFIAMSPERKDIQDARAGGLQNVDGNRRAEYVADAEGFIELTQDKKYQLYTKRALFKDFVPIDAADQSGNFFAERILVHEAGATAVAKYTAPRPESFVAILAPTADVRYMGGINGRIPRICRFINKGTNKVNEAAVTTILLNPTAEDTLSSTKRLRLEIGTAPETIPYQTKVADYLWFSTMPKVNMIPRLMKT